MIQYSIFPRLYWNMSQQTARTAQGNKLREVRPTRDYTLLIFDPSTNIDPGWPVPCIAVVNNLKMQAMLRGQSERSFLKGHLHGENNQNEYQWNFLI